MARFVLDRLTFFALFTLEDVVEEASQRANCNNGSPMRRTWAIRLALSYLRERGIDPMAASSFWNALVDPQNGQLEAMAAYIRHRDLNSYLQCMYREAGLPRGSGPVPITIKKLRTEPAPHVPVERTPYIPEPPLDETSWDKLQEWKKSQPKVPATSHPSGKRR